MRIYLSLLIVFFATLPNQLFAVTDEAVEEITERLEASSTDELIERREEILKDLDSDSDDIDRPSLLVELSIIEQLLILAGVVLLDNISDEASTPPDTVFPIITILGDNPATVELGSTYTDAGATSDGGETVSSSGTVDTNTIGSYTITYSATDAAGNTSTATRTVNVVDTTAPVITGDSLVNTEVSQTAGSYSMEPGITASDNSSTALTKSVSDTVNIAVLGGYTDTTTFTDVSGNSSSLTRIVRVVDTTAPTVEVLGDNPVLVIQYGSYTESGATAVDNSAGPLEKGILGTVDVTTVGDYTLTYTFTDVSGNVGTGTRLVEVRPAGTTETGTSTYSTGTGTTTSSATSTGS